MVDVEFTFEDNQITGYVTLTQFEKVMLPALVKLSGSDGHAGRYRVQENDRILTVRMREP